MYCDKNTFAKMRESSVLAMHKSSPEFIEKLYTMLEDGCNEQYIRWNTNGLSFLILNPPEFARNVLENHFKHGNLSSFVRQLNKYDFHKIKSAENILETFGSQVWEFKNEHFQRNRRDLMFKIKRKRSSSEKTMRNSSDTGGYGSDLGTMFQNQTLNTLKVITRYFQVIVEDINELKALIVQERTKTYLGIAKILVIEDNMSCSNFALTILSKMEHTTVIAETEEDGLLKLESDKFDIVLVSFLLRNSNALIRKIRHLYNDIQIVLLTEKCYKNESLPFLNIGVNEILIKPYCQDTMFQLMNKCLDQKKRNIPWTPYNENQ
ncbi:kinase-regulated stress-responsive transcription factor skn7 [Binucleata daphniae]